MKAPTRENIAVLMPQLKEDLARLVAIPSVSALGYPEATRPAILEAHGVVAEHFREIGVQVDVLELPDTVARIRPPASLSFRTKAPTG